MESSESLISEDAGVNEAAPPLLGDDSKEIFGGDESVASPQDLGVHVEERDSRMNVVDLIHDLDILQRNDLARLLIISIFLGGISAATIYIPQFIQAGYYMPLSAALTSTGFVGTSLFKGLSTFKTLSQVLFVSWVVLSLKALMPTAQTEAIMVYFLSILVTLFYSLFLPAIERNLCFGFTPVIIFSTVDNINQYIGGHFLSLLFGVVLALLLNVCPIISPPFSCNLKARQSSERVRFSLSKAAHLLDEAALRLFLLLPLSVVSEPKEREAFLGQVAELLPESSPSSMDDNDDVGAHTHLIFEQSLSSTKALINAASCHLDEVSPFQLAGLAFEPTVSAEEHALAKSGAKYVGELLHSIRLCARFLEGGRMNELLVSQHSISKGLASALADNSEGDSSVLADGAESRDGVKNLSVGQIAITTARIAICTNAALRGLVSKLEQSSNDSVQSLRAQIPLEPPTSLEEAKALYRSACIRDDNDFHEDCLEDLSLFAMAMAYDAFNLQEVVENPPVLSRFAQFKDAVRTYMLPRRFYKDRAGGSLWIEVILANRIVVAMAVAALWDLIPYLYQGQSNSPAFEKLKGEVALTVGVVWSDIAGGAFQRFTDRAAGVLIGVVASAIYFMYVPAFPFTSVPWYMICFPLIIIAGHVQDHAYISTAAFASFLVTFQVSVDSATNSDAFNGPNSTDARTFAINICLARVLATMYGILIAMTTIVFLYPQTAAKDFYRAVKGALDDCSNLMALEAQRLRNFDPESSGSEDSKGKKVQVNVTDTEDDFGFQEAHRLFDKISRVQQNGLLAAAEYSWLSPPFPASFTVDLTRVLRELQVGMARARQARLQIVEADRIILARTETFQHGYRILGKHMPALLGLLSDLCEKAYSGYKGEIRIKIEEPETLDTLLKDVRNTFDKRFEQVYRLESESSDFSKRQKASLFRFVHALRHLHRGVLEISRALCVLKIIRTTKRLPAVFISHESVNLNSKDVALKLE